MIAPWVIKGAMDGTAFAAYVEKVLVPELSPGTVVIAALVFVYGRKSYPLRCATPHLDANVYEIGCTGIFDRCKYKR